MKNSGSKYIHGTSKSEQSRLSKLNYMTNKDFIDFVDAKPTDIILELGSGLGILTESISQGMTSGKVVGIEISDKQIEKCPSQSEKLEFIKGDVHILPFDNNTFDKIYCRYILEHTDDPQGALSEALRVLKARGEIYIQENAILLIEFYPDCPKFKKIWNKFAELQAKLHGDAMIGIKLFYLLKTAGFTEIELSIAPEIHSKDSATFESWIDNLIGNIIGVKEKLFELKMASIKEIQEVIEELNNFKKNEFSSTYFYWNRAKAVAQKKFA